MENLFLFVPYENFLDKLEKMLISDANISLTRTSDEFADDMLMIEISGDKLMNNPFIKETWRLRDRSTWARINIVEEKNLGIDFDHGVLESIENKVNYNGIYALEYAGHQVVDYLILEYFDDDVFINTVYDNVYPVSYLREMLKQGKELFYTSCNILEQDEEDWH